MRYLDGNTIYLNAKQANEFLGENTLPSDIESFDGMPARAFYAKGHEGMYIVFLTDEEE